MGSERPTLWGIVLAGGEGERLRGFVREVLGTDAPKQFCAFLGRRTMVEHTLRRAETLIPPDRLLVVVTATHQQHIFTCLGRRPPGTVLLQPVGRDTGPGLMLPLLHILHRDPRALVAVLPSDHFIMPGQRFMKAVAAGAAFLTGEHAGSVVLLAVEPTDPETEYGWVKPGQPVAISNSVEVRRVRGFVEKPSAERACGLMAEGGLWNTMVMVARAKALLSMVRRACPELAAYFSMIQQSIGTLWEPDVLANVYRMMPGVNFSNAVLTRSPDQLLVLPVRNVFWSDWGRADRILATLARFGIPSPMKARMEDRRRTTPHRVGVG